MRKHIYHANNLALAGTDPVSYFTENRKRAGLKRYAFNWGGLEWRFSSQANLNLFIQSPEKFLPQYGGYCAFGISNGYKAKPQLSCFTILDDKLFLNFSPLVKKRWINECQERIHRADLQWNQVKINQPIRANRHMVLIKYILFKLVGKDSLS